MEGLIAPREQALANYDYNDIARGISNVVFYGGAYNHGNNVSGMALSNSTFWSDPIVLKAGSGVIDREIVMSKDFDLSFGSPRVVKGTMVINVPMGVGQNAAAQGNKVVYVSGMLTVSKISNGATTQLGKEGTSVHTDTIADSDMTGYMFCVMMDIPSTKFKKDDVLRLKVDLWGKTGDGDVVFGIGCDPQNRNDTETTTPSFMLKAIPDDVDTIMSVQIPFKIDV